MSDSMNTPEPFYIEIVKQRFGGAVVSSEVRLATFPEFIKAYSLYKRGQCDHSIIKDERSFMYDYRSCRLCGKELGAI